MSRIMHHVSNDDDDDFTSLHSFFSINTQRVCLCERGTSTVPVSVAHLLNSLICSHGKDGMKGKE